MSFRRTFLIAAAIGLILAATLASGNGGTSLWSTRLLVADLVLNVALFIPLGMAARKAGLRTVPTVLLAAALSLGVEAAQLAVVSGRTASPWDIAANTAGALVGAEIPIGVLFIVIACGWVGSGWLLAPAPPRNAIWWGQIAHRFPTTGRYSGTIASARINGLEIPDGRFNELETGILNTWAAAGTLDLAVTTTPPVTTSSRRAQLVSLVDGRGGEIFGLWQRGDRLEVTWNSRGSALGLYRGRVLTASILSDTTAPQPIHLAVQLTRGRVVVNYHQGTDNGKNRSYHLRLGPWEGWRLLWPFTMAAPELAAVITWLWTIGSAAAALIGLGYIAKAVGRPGD